MEVLDFCTESHKSSSFTRRKSRTSNNPVPVLRIPSKYGWMSCSLNESNLNQLRHKLHAWKQGRPNFLHYIFSEPLKLLLLAMGSGLGSALVGARLGSTPDRCLA